MADNSDITAPATKAVTAIAAGAGTTAMSLTQQAQSFLPTDLNGWMALTASTLAVLYSLHLFAEWYWKKAVRPFCERRGWLKPREKRLIVIDPDQLQEAE